VFGENLFVFFMVRLLFYIILVTSLWNLAGYKKILLYVFFSTATGKIFFVRTTIHWITVVIWHALTSVLCHSANHDLTLNLPDRLSSTTCTSGVNGGHFPTPYPARQSMVYNLPGFFSRKFKKRAFSTRSEVRKASSDFQNLFTRPDLELWPQWPNIVWIIRVWCTTRNQPLPDPGRAKNAVFFCSNTSCFDRLDHIFCIGHSEQFACFTEIYRTMYGFLLPDNFPGEGTVKTYKDVLEECRTNRKYRLITIWPGHRVMHCHV